MGNIVPLSTMPKITIDSDGNITPATDVISRNGNVYTFIDDLEGYAVSIERSNIVFNGAGHTIHTPPPEADKNPAGAGLTLNNVNNVTVKNLEVSGVALSTGIKLVGSYNCLLTVVKTISIDYSDSTERVNQVWLIGDFNTITESNIRLTVNGDNNLFIENNVQYLFVSGSNNRFYQNNFFLTDVPSILNGNFWDNGSIGNYWNNYLTKYPNASEIDNTGIGDTAHIIDRLVAPSLNDPNARNIDNFPLMYPWSVPPEIEILNVKNAIYIGSFPLNFTVSKSAKWMGYSLDGKANVTVAGNVTIPDLEMGLHNVTVYAKDEFENTGASETIIFTVELPEPFPVAPVAAASVASVGIVAVGLLVYFKKRKH
jgi:hypothetical protein